MKAYPKLVPAICAVISILLIAFVVVPGMRREYLRDQKLSQLKIRRDSLVVEVLIKHRIEMDSLKARLKAVENTSY